jgi:hypothetical protein
LEPHARWSVGFSGELEREDDGTVVPADLELVFDSTAPPFLPGTDDDPDLVAASLAEVQWDRRLLRVLRRGIPRAYVQPGVAHGSLALGSRVLALRARTLRLHGWGPRDFGTAVRALQAWFVHGGTEETSYVHRSEFPWLTIEGGFHADDDGRVARLESIGITREVEASGHTRRLSAHLRWGRGSEERRHVRAEPVARTSLRVDARGDVELALLRLPEGGCGLWVAQQRVSARGRW